MNYSRLSASALTSIHDELCFKRAFPESLIQNRTAKKELNAFGTSIETMAVAKHRALEDSGIAGTLLNYRFSFHVAKWLARKVPGEASIDWLEIDDTERLAELLQTLLLPSEDDYFDSGIVSCQEWIDLARAGHPGTDFDWLIAQLVDSPHTAVLARLYDAVDLPVVWNLRGSQYSKTQNVFYVRAATVREKDMRGRPAQVSKAIQEPMSAMQKTSRRTGVKLIDVAMASLAVRHRETLHFNHANPDEVYMVSVGKGVSIVIFGLLPEYRYPLECTMGYLLLSNGVPIGYGGTSVLFRQANTGVNLFDEYRGSEAAFLWVQVMRAYHTLMHCTRYIANPYQFGGDNDEALASGAFWFYYNLGFRPIKSSVRELAKMEVRKKQKKRSYRSNIQTLRRLASCDMHLTLPGAKKNEYFDEEWLVTSSYLATKLLGSVATTKRKLAANNITKMVAQDLGISSLDDWSSVELRAFDAIAPFVAMASPASWPTKAKRTMRTLIRVKGDHCEVPFARLLAKHETFRLALSKACRREAKIE